MPFRSTTDYNHYVLTQLHTAKNSFRLENVVCVRPFSRSTEILEMKLSHASLKDPQTIGVVERAHAAVLINLKLNRNQTFTQ